MMTKVVVLGKVISIAGIELGPSKVKVLSQLSIATMKKQVRLFLGFAGYYLCSINGFINISIPLLNLLSKDVVFLWIEQFQDMFKTLKEKFLVVPILRWSNWVLHSCIFIDALDIRHKKSTFYHHQENGQVESVKNILESIVTEIIQIHHKHCVE